MSDASNSRDSAKSRPLEGSGLVTWGTGGSMAVCVVILGQIFRGLEKLNDPLFMAAAAILSITFGAMIVAGMVRMGRARNSEGQQPGDLPAGMISANMRGSFYGVLVGLLVLLVLR